MPYLLTPRCLHSAIALWASLMLFQSAGADETDRYAGRVEALVGGERVVLTALSSHYDIKVRGDVVNVALTQSFSNPFSRALNATYLFPLNRQAAVHRMKMLVGDELVEAVIKEKQEAQRSFDQAKREGKAAALLTQHRPNQFTQKVANLLPGQLMQITIEYNQVLSKVDGAYQLVVPMVVGPRYEPRSGYTNSPVEDEPTVYSAQTDVVLGAPALPEGRLTYPQIDQTLPTYPSAAGVHIDSTGVKPRVSLSLDLETPLALRRVNSDTHVLAVREISSTQQMIEFDAGQVLDDRDFVLRYRFDGEAMNSGLMTHWDVDDGGYFNLLIEPPSEPGLAAKLPREMVFLLDCSGSMNGLPMRASKAFVVEALSQLTAEDTFRIIRFSDRATEFSSQPLPATAENIRAGKQYIQGLYGSGGTEMSSGIRQALQGSITFGRVRNVVFLTDGYIGNEIEILRLVRARLGEGRLFAFGVGTAVNRYLLSELGRVGRGFTRYFDPTKDEQTQAEVVRDLAARLKVPVLRDVQIDWGALQVSEVLPNELPDLYAGQSIRVTGRYGGYQQGELTISGIASNENGAYAAEWTQPVTLPDVSVADSQDSASLRRVWARTKVADLMHRYTTPIPVQDRTNVEKQLRQQITDIGLQYALATQWTSFVAVARQIQNYDPQNNVSASVAVPKVAGVSQLAYPNTGYAAPEPGTWLTLFASLFIGLWVFRRYGAKRAI